MMTSSRTQRRRQRQPSPWTTAFTTSTQRTPEGQYSTFSDRAWFSIGQGYAYKEDWPACRALITAYLILHCGTQHYCTWRHTQVYNKSSSSGISNKSQLRNMVPIQAWAVLSAPPRPTEGIHRAYPQRLPCLQRTIYRWPWRSSAITPTSQPSIPTSQ